MQEKRSQPRTQNRSVNAGFGRMLVFSLGLHLAVVVLFAGGFLPRAPKRLEPLYYIDLANLPVKSPRAGRPDVRPQPEKKPEIPPAPAAKPEAPPPPPPQTPPKAEPVKPAVKIEPKPKPPEPVAKPAPAAKTPPKPAPAPPEAAPRPQETYNRTLDAIEKLRREKEIAELKNKIAALATADSRQSEAAEVPLGMPQGKGTEAGADEQEWIRKFLKESWNLSKYQVTRRDLKAQTKIVFDAQGQLLDYKIIESSGDATFDDSVRKAILKAKQLPFKPERRLSIEAEFNLKDLLE